MSDMDQRLKRALDEHTEGVRVVADLADRAIARDRSNRRRELGVAALAAGLVLAVAVPVGWGALRPTGARPLPVGPSQSTTAPTGRPSPMSTPTSGRPTTVPTPTAIPTVTADGAPAPGTLRPATGDPTDTTTVPFYVDRTIHDGSTQIHLQSKGQSGTLARLAGGHWLLTGEQTMSTLLVDSTGAGVGPGSPLVGTATVADDGSLFVLQDRGTLRAYDSSGTLVDTLSATTCDCTPEGVSDAESPGYDAIGIIGSVVYANRGFTGKSVAWDVSSGSRRPVDGPLELVNAARGTALVPVAQEAGSDQTCKELRDLASGRTIWRLCGPLVFRSFSTNGDYLLATGEMDGLAESQLNPDRTFRYGGLVVVRTSDAAIVLEGSGDVTTGNGSPVTYRMGSDDRVTVQVRGATGKRSLQVCALDGRCAVVAPEHERDNPDIPEGDDPYFLADN